VRSYSRPGDPENFVAWLVDPTGIAGTGSTQFEQGDYAMKKGLIYGGGAVVVIVVIAVALVIFRAGDVIKAVVEELGPQMTKSEVTLEKVDLSLSSGEANLSGLLIGNPESFKTPHVFKLDNISVKIDIGSIGEDTIVIKEISINAPDVIAEFGKFTFNPLKSSESIQ
jgi:hypothetical protein